MGYGTNTTTYGPFGRLFLNGNWRSSQNPSLKCSQSNDYFTVSGSGRGNHELTYPVGLITSDEVVLAGGYSSTNQSYYLYTNSAYWTMSPCWYSVPNARVFAVDSNGTLNVSYVNDAYGVRPVINLKANATISGGNGTSGSPYVIS